jgi:hypothetical protein
LPVHTGRLLSRQNRKPPSMVPSAGRARPKTVERRLQTSHFAQAVPAVCTPIDDIEAVSCDGPDRFKGRAHYCRTSAVRPLASFALLRCPP